MTEEQKQLLQLGAGDSSLLYDFLPWEENCYEALRDEIEWEPLYQQGNAIPRLVKIQGTISNDGTQPLYRKPLDIRPQLIHWTPVMNRIRLVLMQHFQVELNHSVPQLYRDGRDFCGEHSDKTLDIQHHTSIYNLTLYSPNNSSSSSLRTLQLRHKTDKAQSQSFQLPHNCLFVLGWNTNRTHYHAIPKEANAGERISLTFRTIATFIRTDGFLFGQGATHKTREALERDVGPVTRIGIDRFKQQMQQAQEKHLISLLSTSSSVTQRNQIATTTTDRTLFTAFGYENRQGLEFDWNVHYGPGFDLIDPFTGVAIQTRHALLVVDAQNEFLDSQRYSYFGRKHCDVATLVQKMMVTIQQCRTHNIPVYFIRAEYDHTTTTSSNTKDTHSGHRICCPPRTHSSEIYPPIAALIQDADEVIVKQYFSAFHQTNLHALLQQRNINSLIVIGVHTNVCVQHTCVDAIELQYPVYVVESGCAAFTEQKHLKALQQLEQLNVNVIDDINSLFI